VHVSRTPPVYTRAATWARPGQHVGQTRATTWARPGSTWARPGQSCGPGPGSHVGQTREKISIFRPKNWRNRRWLWRRRALNLCRPRHGESVQWRTCPRCALCLPRSRGHRRKQPIGANVFGRGAGFVRVWIGAGARLCRDGRPVPTRRT
jgi:hypothetical protein